MHVPPSFHPQSTDKPLVPSRALRLQARAKTHSTYVIRPRRILHIGCIRHKGVRRRHGFSGRQGTTTEMRLTRSNSQRSCISAITSAHIRNHSFDEVCSVFPSTLIPVD